MGTCGRLFKEGSDMLAKDVFLSYSCVNDELFISLKQLIHSKVSYLFSLTWFLFKVYILDYKLIALSSTGTIKKTISVLFMHFS